MLKICIDDLEKEIRERWCKHYFLLCEVLFLLVMICGLAGFDVLSWVIAVGNLLFILRIKVLPISGIEHLDRKRGEFVICSKKEGYNYFDNSFEWLKIGEDEHYKYYGGYWNYAESKKMQKIVMKWILSDFKNYILLIGEKGV